MTALAGGAAALGGCVNPFAAEKMPLVGAGRVPYGDTIGDRLWMWGHHRDAFKKLVYNVPLFGSCVDMAPACKEMGIPGCFVVRWENMPDADELPEYMKQFANTKRIGFSIADNAVELFDEKVELGLAYADRLPNLTTLIMDDFWQDAARGVTMRKLRDLRRETAARNLRLSIVAYSDREGLGDEQREVFEFCDEVTLWFWNGRNTGGIEEQVGRLREMVGPEKSVLLGQYMWDFGGKKPMPGDVMAHQLEQTSRLLSKKAIDGVIFHCTPLVGLGLDAVKVSKAWIAANANRRWGV